MKHDLVNEFWLQIYPLTVGSGKRLFVNSTIPAAFQVTDSQVSTSGIIIVNYQALRSGYSQFFVGKLIISEFTRSIPNPHVLRPRVTANMENRQIDEQ